LVRNSESEELPAATEHWIEPPRPPGQWSARVCAAAALACAGLGVLQGALGQGWLPPLPLAGSLDAGLSSAGLSPGNLLLSGLLLAAVSRCLSALERHHRASAPDGRFENELRSTLENQADQIQHLHVSTLGIERSLLEQNAQSQALTDGRLEAQRGSLEHLRAQVDSLRQELHKPRAETPKESERWQRLEQRLEQRLAELEGRLEVGLAALEKNLSGELVQASETLAQWLSRERSALGDSLERDPQLEPGESTAAAAQASAGTPAYDPRNDRIELEELPRVESIEIDPELLETARAALPTRIAELEEPLYDPLELDAGQHEFSPLEREESESWRSAPGTGSGRSGFASAPLLEPNDAAALAQTGFHRVQSLGFLDGIEEPSHPELAGAGPQEPPRAALDQTQAPLPGRARSAAKERTPRSAAG
jgi:hypothetical protein